MRASGRSDGPRHPGVQGFRSSARPKSRGIAELRKEDERLRLETCGGGDGVGTGGRVTTQHRCGKLRHGSGGGTQGSLADDAVVAMMMSPQRVLKHKAAQGTPACSKEASCRGRSCGRDVRGCADLGLYPERVGLRGRFASGWASPVRMNPTLAIARAPSSSWVMGFHPREAPSLSPLSCLTTGSLARSQSR